MASATFLFCLCIFIFSYYNGYGSDNMKNKKFIDFNGVILDTDSRLLELKKQKQSMTWKEFIETIDWGFLLDTSLEIDGALSFLREISHTDDETYILTNADFIKEQVAKVQFLRKNEINLPIIFVPTGIQKSEIYFPHQGDILVDDRPENIMFWNQCGGKGYLFDPEERFPDSLPKIKSLHSLRHL